MNNVQDNKDITHLSNYKTPARARWFYEIFSLSQMNELHEVISWAESEKQDILWISSWTNMLFAFEEYDGIVIKNSLLWWSYDSRTKILKANGAEEIWEIAEKLEHDYRQDLWHRFIGLPWSIAWAVYWNAGCFGLETQNNFVSCEVLNLETGQIQSLTKDEMNFEYRSSLLKQTKKYFLISAIFDLSEKIEKYHSEVDNIDFRENKQPKWNSCGSFFKNPSKEQSAGYLIESVWLKWYKLWWAYFSQKHANFLMHDGNGLYEDMIDLISLAREKVEKKFWVTLENEVQIIKNKKL